MNGNFTLDRGRGKLMGVAAGLSDWTGVDVLAVRLALIITVLVAGPIAVLLYFVTGWLAAGDR